MPRRLTEPILTSRLRNRRSVCRVPDGGEQPVEVRTARPAGAKVCGHAGIALMLPVARGDQPDMHVQNLQRLVAALERLHNRARIAGGC